MVILPSWSSRRGAKCAAWRLCPHDHETALPTMLTETRNHVITSLKKMGIVIPVPAQGAISHVHAHVTATHTSTANPHRDR